MKMQSVSALLASSALFALSSPAGAAEGMWTFDVPALDRPVGVCAGGVSEALRKVYHADALADELERSRAAISARPCTS